MLGGCDTRPEYAPGSSTTGFDWLRVFDGRAFATGYYEPEIEGSRTPLPGYAPIYRVPADLVRCTRPTAAPGAAASTRPALACSITPAPRSMKAR